MRGLLIGVITLLCASSASALDEVVLKNGRRYLGTIVANTPTTIVLAIDGGTVEFPRTSVVSPPYMGADQDGDGEAFNTTPGESMVGSDAAHPLPNVAEALQKLAAFPWVRELRQVPVMVAIQGRWQFLPCVSFWAGDFFQVSFYGDPARPSAIEVSLHHPPDTAWEQKQRLLEYMLSVSPGLALDNRFDALDVNGDQFAIGDLWFEVTGPDSTKTPGRWTVLLLHELSVNAARASYDDLQVISELLPAATIDPAKPRSWQRATWMPDELAWVRQAPGANIVATSEAEAVKGTRTPAFTALGGERVYVRAYVRERGKYARAANDWTRDFAAAVQ